MSKAYTIKRIDPKHPAFPQYLTWDSENSRWTWSTIRSYMALFMTKVESVDAFNRWYNGTTKDLGDLGWTYQIIEVEYKVVEEINPKNIYNHYK